MEAKTIEVKKKRRYANWIKVRPFGDEYNRSYLIRRPSGLTDEQYGIHVLERITDIKAMASAQTLEIEMPGVRAVPMTAEERQGDIPLSQFPSGSRNLVLEILADSAAAMQLKDDEFCEIHAKKFFNWVIDNMPHGICHRFYEMMKAYKGDA